MMIHHPQRPHQHRRYLATLNVDDGGDNNTTTTTTTTPEKENDDFEDDESDSLYQTPTPVVTLLHNAPRGLTFRGHTNRIATIVSSNTQEQFQYAGGLKYFCVMFVVVPFAIWTACLFILKFVYTPSRVGCAAGGQHLDMKQLSKQGVSRKQRKVRILRSYRLQSTFMIVAVLVPILSTVMMMKGYKPFVDESLPQIQSLVDDVETLTYRGWNAVTGIKSASRQLLTNNVLIQEILHVNNQQQQQGQSLWGCDTSTLVDTTTASNSNTTQSEQIQEAVKVFSSTMSSVEEQTSEMVRMVENYLLTPSSDGSGLLPTDETFHVVTSTTQSIDESIEWFLRNDWIFKFVVMVLNVAVLLLTASVFFVTKNNYYHEPTRAYNSYVLIPLLCISAVTLLVMTCTIGVSALINGDFCSGGGGGNYDIEMNSVGISQHGSPQATFQDVIMMAQYGTLDRSVRSQHFQDGLITMPTSSNATETPLPLLDLSTARKNITDTTKYDNVYDLLWDAINYYSNQCLDETQNPFLFLGMVQQELDSAIAQTHALLSLIDSSSISPSSDDTADFPSQDPNNSDNSSSTTSSNGSSFYSVGGGDGNGTALDRIDQSSDSFVQLLNEICGAKITDGIVDSDFVDFLPAAINDLRDELMELKSQLSLLIDDTLSCHQISPIFRLLQRGALCTTSPHGLAVTWICSFCICVLCFVLLSVRAALFNTIQKKKPRPHKPRHVVEKEFAEYQQFMKQFYDDDEVMNSWLLDEPLPTAEHCKSKAKLFDFEKTAICEADHGVIPLNPTMETEPEILEDENDKFDFTAVMDTNELHVINPTTDDEIARDCSAGHILQRDDLINDKVEEAEVESIDDGDDHDDAIADSSTCGSSFESVVSDEESDNDSCNEIEDEQSAMESFISETRSVAMLTAISVQSALKPLLDVVRLRKTVRSTPSSTAAPLSPSKFIVGGQSVLNDDEYARSIFDDITEKHPSDEEERVSAKNPLLLTNDYASDDVSVSSCTPVPQKVVSSKRFDGSGNGNVSNLKRMAKQNSGIFLPKSVPGRIYDKSERKKTNGYAVSANKDDVIADDMEDYEPSLSYIMPSYHQQKTEKKAPRSSAKHHRESRRDPKSSPACHGSRIYDTTVHGIVDVILSTPGSVVSALTPDRPIKGFSFLSRTGHNHGTDVVDDSFDSDTSRNSIIVSRSSIPSTPPPSSTFDEEERSPLVVRPANQEYLVSRKAPRTVTNPKQTDGEVEKKTSTGSQAGARSKRIVLGESVRHKVSDNQKPTRLPTSRGSKSDEVVAEIESTPIITPAKASKESTFTGKIQGDFTASDDLVLPPDPPKPRKSLRSLARLKFLDSLEDSIDEH